MADREFSLRGRLVLLEDKTGVCGLTVVVYDKDLLFDDRLGSAISRHGGRRAGRYGHGLDPGVWPGWLAERVGRSELKGEVSDQALCGRNPE
jgi:hypothetical protein